jgi:hypothetical protein
MYLMRLTPVLSGGTAIVDGVVRWKFGWGVWYVAAWEERGEKDSAYGARSVCKWSKLDEQSHARQLCHMSRESEM